MEDRLDLRLQPAGYHRLGDPVRDRGHPQHPDPATRLRISTARTGGGK